MVLVLYLYILYDNSLLLFWFPFVFRICITFMRFMIGCFCSSFFLKRKNNNKERNEKCVLHYFSWTCNQGWPYYLYITCLYTLFSLNELILLHFASFSYVVHVVWKLFIVFDHLIFILKLHAFDCLNLNLMRKA